MRYLPIRRESAPSLVFWLPTFAGVLVLIGALLFTLMRLYESPERAADPLPQPIAPFEPLTPASFVPRPETSGPGTAPPSGGSGGSSTKPAPAGYSPTARPSPTPSRTTRPSVGTPAPASAVRGTYRVLDSYGDVFIGEVLISNASGQDRNWTVTLRFPSNVGKLNTSWVEGAQQATLTTSGATYTWRSGVPVPAGSSVPLRFHFDRSGTGDYPTTCTTNGAACSIR